MSRDINDSAQKKNCQTSGHLQLEIDNCKQKLNILQLRFKPLSTLKEGKFEHPMNC